MSSHNQIRILNKESGQRIDNFLLIRCKNLSKTVLYKWIRTGQIRVNSSRIKPFYKLEINDIIRIPPFCKLKSENKNHFASSKLANFLIHQILYEDKDILVLNKPSGIACHGGSGVHKGVIESLRILPQFKKDKLELVHRLDRDTSGCLLISKKKSILRLCHEVFRNKKVTKIYHALVQGYVHKKKWICQYPLKKHRNDRGEWWVAIDNYGQHCVTQFRKIAQGKQMTLIEAKPVTGRTHQIRVHLAQESLPIIGDQKYNMKTNKNLRLMLHAFQLKLKLDIWNDELVIVASYSDDFAALAKTL